MPLHLQHRIYNTHWFCYHLIWGNQVNSFLSSRLSYIKPSPTLTISSKAKALKSAGNDIIDLSLGEPDFDTPNSIKQAAIEAINAGKTKYTPVDGTPALKKAICGKLLRENNLSYTEDQITVGTGAKQVIFNSIFATVNKGDEAIIPAPYWVSYLDIVAFAEGTPVVVECNEANGFKLKADQLEKAITNKTKWLFLNSPSNPSGAAYTNQELEKLGEVLLKHPHVHILSDDIYEHITFDGFKFYTIAEVVPALKDRVLVVNGVSKSYSMTGWRIGYGAGNKDLIKAIGTIQSQSTSNPCSISQEAALNALTGNQSFIEDHRKLFENRKHLILKLIQKIPDFTQI